MHGLNLGEAAESVVRKLREAGEKAYFVGGCVRDMVMGKAPADYDIATSATPDRVERLFSRTRPIGAAFGVVLVLVGEHAFEVATFRREEGYSDGRRPDKVEFADETADVLRRDFTVNGLLQDPMEGRLVDHVGGRADIEARVIRAIGDPKARFSEDALRMMRAVRFACSLSFEIERSTLDAIRRMHEGIRRISWERIRDELVRILTEGAPARGMRLLDEAGLLAEILPEVAAMKGVEQPPRFHPEGDVWTHTLKALELMKDPTPGFAAGVLLHDVGKPLTISHDGERFRFDNHARVGEELARDICARLRFSRAETEEIASLVRNHMRFLEVRRMRESRLKRFMRDPYWKGHLELHRLDCLASHGKLDNFEFCLGREEDLKEEDLRPERLISGRDLVEMGYEPGPAFGRVLRELEDAQLEARVRTVEEAKGFAKEYLGPPPGRTDEEESK